jgi:hypothetical protein
MIDSEGFNRGLSAAYLPIMWGQGESAEREEAQKGKKGDLAVILGKAGDGNGGSHVQTPIGLSVTRKGTTSMPRLRTSVPNAAAGPGRAAGV